jgi:hypothetical protein
MAKAKQKETGTVTLELPVADAPETSFGLYIEGELTPRQSHALRTIGEGLNGKLGVYAKAGGKLKNIHIVRCILEVIADQLEANPSPA